MDLEVAKRLLKRLKAFLIVAGISFFAFIVWAIVHNVFHGLSETEETISFIIAYVMHLVFVIATVSGLVVFLKGRVKKHLRETDRYE